MSTIGILSIYQVYRVERGQTSIEESRLAQKMQEIKDSPHTQTTKDGSTTLYTFSHTKPLDHPFLESSVEVIVADLLPQGPSEGDSLTYTRINNGSSWEGFRCRFTSSLGVPRVEEDPRYNNYPNFIEEELYQDLHARLNPNKNFHIENKSSRTNNHQRVVKKTKT